MYEIIIRGGTVVDGTGAPRYRADVAVQDGKIAKIAPHIEGEAQREIDASGKIVSPGFIDYHSHSDNTILLGDNEELYARELTACRVNWISGTAPTEPVAVTAKTRYSQTEAEAEVTPLPEGRMRVVFRQPQRAITSGQAVVLYDGDTVLGGGVIEDR